MDVTTTQGTCRVISGGCSKGPADVLDAGLSSCRAPRPPGSVLEGWGPGGAARSYYLLRLTGRLSLV